MQLQSVGDVGIGIFFSVKIFPSPSTKQAIIQLEPAINSHFSFRIRSGMDAEIFTLFGFLLFISLAW